MEREKGRRNVIVCAVTGLALAGGLLLSMLQPSHVRDRQAVQQVTGTRADVTRVADGTPFPKTPCPTCARVADGTPFPKTGGPGGARVADGTPFPKTGGPGGARVA